MYVTKAFADDYFKPARARLRGLARNPAVPAVLLRRLVDEQFKEVRWSLAMRASWSDEQFEALAGHPDPGVRTLLAEARYVTPEQRVRLVEDPDRGVLRALAEGPDMFAWWTLTPEPLLPAWGYERLAERAPRLKDSLLVENPWIPAEVRAKLWPDRPITSPAPAPVDADPTPLDRTEAEAMVADPDPWKRTEAADDPRLPPDLVARLSHDPAATVRLAVSMRPELSEEQRTAIEYHVGPADRIRTARWAVNSRDVDAQRRCVYSAHLGLRRSVALNRHLPPELVRVLATDDDFAVRLLLCENHTTVPEGTVLATYLEARTATRGRLLRHPSFQRVGLARLADDPNPDARALVPLDPDATPDVIERLSHDPYPGVRAAVAADARLSPARVLALLDDPAATERAATEGAAANPHLPVPVMEAILNDAADSPADPPAGPVEGRPTVYLGRWTPESLRAAQKE